MANVHSKMLRKRKSTHAMTTRAKRRREIECINIPIALRLNMNRIIEFLGFLPTAYLGVCSKHCFRLVRSAPEFKIRCELLPQLNAIRDAFYGRRRAVLRVESIENVLNHAVPGVEIDSIVAEFVNSLINREKARKRVHSLVLALQMWAINKNLDRNSVSLHCLKWALKSL